MSKSKSRISKEMDDVDYSAISFDVNFIPELGGAPEFSGVFRQMKFKELREWSRILSPNSDVHSGDRTDRMLDMLKRTILEPSDDEFEAWIDELYEDDAKRFIQEFSDAKQEGSKK